MPVQDSLNFGCEELCIGFQELFFSLKEAGMIFDKAFQAAVGLADKVVRAARDKSFTQLRQVVLNPEAHDEQRYKRDKK